MDLYVSFCYGHQLLQVLSSQILFMGKLSESLELDWVAFFAPAVKQIASPGYVSGTQGLFRFCSCFEFNALPISLNPKTLKSEVETTDDQEGKCKKREENHNMCLSNMKPLAVLLIARAEEKKWFHFARLWAFSLAMKVCLYIYRGLQKC